MVGLSFVDLLYAIPVADLAMRVDQTGFHGIPLRGLGDISLSLIVIVLAWMGHQLGQAIMVAQVDEQ